MPSGYTRYKDDKELFKATPSVFVNAKGEVFEYLPNIHESPKKAQVRLINGIPYVKLRNILFLHGAFDNQYPLIEIVAMAFKPMSMNSCFWKYIQAHPIDGNPLNVRPENIVRRFINGPFSIDGINYVIPGYTQYTIDKKANIINTRRNEIKSLRREPNGSGQVSMKPDLVSSKQTLSYGIDVSRALALTFLSYSNNVYNEVVNHKDGDRSNNDLGNLEWLTVRENVVHSVVRKVIGFEPPSFLYKEKEYNEERIEDFFNQRGLKIPKCLKNQKDFKVSNRRRRDCSDFTLPVYVFDAVDKTVTKYENRTNVARFLRTRNWEVDFALSKKDKLKGFLFGRYKLFLEGEEIPSYTDEEISIALNRSTFPKPILLKNLRTKEVTKYKTVREFLEDNKVLGKNSRKVLNAGTQRTNVEHLLIKYESNKDPWIE